MKGFWSTIFDENSQPIENCTITVYLSTGVLATIYSNETGTAKNNPMLSDTYGRYSFFAAAGKYYLKFEKTGFTTWTSDYITIPDEVDETSEDTTKNKYVSNKLIYDLKLGKYKLTVLDNIQCNMPMELIRHILSNLKSSLP